jgi:hypothetical protein
MNGVLSFPDAPAASAYRIASSMKMSISAFGIADSAGIGLAKCNPEVSGNENWASMHS